MDILKYENNEITYVNGDVEVKDEFEIPSNFVKIEVEENEDGEMIYKYINPKYVAASFGNFSILSNGEMISGEIEPEFGIKISSGRIINPELIVVVLEDRIEMLNATIHNLTKEDKEKLK